MRQQDKKQIPFRLDEETRTKLKVKVITPYKSKNASIPMHKPKYVLISVINIEDIKRTNNKAIEPIPIAMHIFLNVLVTLNTPVANNVSITKNITNVENTAIPQAPLTSSLQIAVMHPTNNPSHIL